MCNWKLSTWMTPNKGYTVAWSNQIAVKYSFSYGPYTANRFTRRTSKHLPDPFPLQISSSVAIQEKKCQNYGSSGGFGQRRYRNMLFSRSQLERKDLYGQDKTERGRSWALSISDAKTLRDKFA